MKKAATVFVSMLACLCLLAACGGAGNGAPPELAGRWELTGAEAMGMTLTVKDLEATGASVEIEFNFINASEVEVKGSAVGFGTNEGGAAKAKYTYRNGVVTIEESGSTMEMTLEDGMLKVDAAGVTLLLERV